MTTEELRTLADRVEAYAAGDAVVFTEGRETVKALRDAADKIDKHSMELDVLQSFRDDDRKALQAFQEYDGDSGLWAAMKEQRDAALKRVAALESRCQIDACVLGEYMDAVKTLRSRVDRLTVLLREAQGFVADYAVGPGSYSAKLLAAIEEALTAPLPFGVEPKQTEAEPAAKAQTGTPRTVPPLPDAGSEPRPGH